jgi:hypothetical protein
MLGGIVDADVDVNADETTKEDDEDAFFNDTTEEGDPVKVEQRGKEDNLMSFNTLCIEPAPVKTNKSAVLVSHKSNNFEIQSGLIIH